MHTTSLGLVIKKLFFLMTKLLIEYNTNLKTCSIIYLPNLYVEPNLNVNNVFHLIFDIINF